MAHRFRTTNRDSPAARQRAREYASPEYRRQHERDRALVKSGRAHCWRCRSPIAATARCGPDWQSGHDDHNRSILRGPECSRCNRTAAARAGNAAQRAKRRPVRRAQSRAW